MHSRAGQRRALVGADGAPKLTRPVERERIARALEAVLTGKRPWSRRSATVLTPREEIDIARERAERRNSSVLE